MSRIPLNIQTLYADFSQTVLGRTREAASISRKTVKGKGYIYAVEARGATRVQRYLGPEDDPQVVAEVEEIRRAANSARETRRTATLLRAAGLRGPDTGTGRVLEALSRAGLFDRGLVLVGTVAFQTYSALLGRLLPGSALVTRDADFVAATTAVSVALPGESGGDKDLLSVLRQADGTFAGQPQPNRKAQPCRFTSTAGVEVELLTPTRKREEENPVALPALGASAIPRQYLDFLVQDAAPIAVLFGSGVRVVVPQPVRYAVHKLIVAAVRDPTNVKRFKDLEQARALLAVLGETDPDLLADVLEDARQRGPKWRSAIASSLKQIGPRREP